MPIDKQKSDRGKNTGTGKHTNGAIRTNQSGDSVITLSGRIQQVTPGTGNSAIALVEGFPNVVVYFTQKFVERWKPQPMMFLHHRGKVTRAADGGLLTYANRRTRIEERGEHITGEFTLEAARRAAEKRTTNTPG